MKNEKTWQEACYESANCQCIGRCMFRPVVIDETEQTSKAEIPDKPNFWNEIAKMQKDCGTYREHYSKDEQSAMYDMAETVWRLFVEPLQLKEAEAEVYNKLMFEQNTALQSRVAQLEEAKHIPEWIIKYDQAGHQSSAGKAIRELINIIKK